MNYNVNEKESSGALKGILAFILILIVAALIFIVMMIISKKDNKKEEKKDYTRTIMIYMAGSDLESKGGMATSELDFIDYNKIDNENINVVVIAGGSKKWNNDYISVDETSIFELTSTGFKKVLEQDKRNMGDSKTLSDFLNFVYDNYKTDKYDLIFWNHGGAIQGAEYDELYKYEVLSLDDMETAMVASPFNKDNKLETIIFSTCLNGTIEVANVFKDYSEYLVASEESTSSVLTGSDFEFLHDIETNDTAYDVSYKFLTNYKNKMKNFYEITGYNAQKGYSTYSIVDLAYVDSFVNDVNEFFADIDLASNFNLVARVRKNIYQYPAIDDSYNMVDLYNLVDGLKELSPEKANKVLNDFNNVVVYNWATNAKSRGLSIYFPYMSHSNHTSISKNIYSKMSDFGSYSKFINNFDTIQNSNKTTAKSYKDNNIEISSIKNGEADFKVELTDEQVETFAYATYFVFMDNHDGTYKPIYFNGKSYLDGKTLKGNIKNKQLQIVSDEEEDGEMVHFTYPIILDEIDEDDDYVRYTTGAILEDFTDFSNWKMDNVDITLIYDKNKNTVEIADVLLIEDGMQSRTSVNIKDYKTIAIGVSSGYYFDENGSLTHNNIITGGEVSTDSFEFELLNFAEGDYYAVFVIEDTYGNSSRTDFIKIN